MLTFTFECANEAQLTTLQQAAHFLAEMHHLAQDTPIGQTLSVLEGHALDAGRAFLRDSLRAAVQQRIDGDEKKGAARGSVPARAPTNSRADTTANG
jgi:hypothetical protein